MNPGSSSGQEGAAKDDDSFAAKVTIHGFLSQAYAFSDGNQIIGIPKDGTADYRTAALQIRAAMTETDTFAVQFSHERLGASPLQALHQDVELDWISYEHRFGETAVKLGRIPIPFGIYNEVRDVGPVLPLYRPARPLYEETAFASETLDGIVVSRGFSLGSWHLDTDLHFGNWESFDNRLNPVKSRNSLGAEIWLETPVDGLRVGIGGLRYEAEGATTPKSNAQLSHLSLQGSCGRVNAEVELRTDTAQRVTGGRIRSVLGGYAHAGIRLVDRLVLQGEYDFLNVNRPGTKLAKDRDRVLGLSYAFRHDLVLKGEYHWAHGFRIDNSPGLIPGRPVPDFKTQFGILSLAVSF